MSERYQYVPDATVKVEVPGWLRASLADILIDAAIQCEAQSLPKRRGAMAKMHLVKQGAALRALADRVRP